MALVASAGITLKSAELFEVCCEAHPICYFSGKPPEVSYLTRNPTPRLRLQNSSRSFLRQLRNHPTREQVAEGIQANSLWFCPRRFLVVAKSNGKGRDEQCCSFDVCIEADIALTEDERTAGRSGAPHQALMATAGRSIVITVPGFDAGDDCCDRKQQVSQFGTLATLELVIRRESGLAIGEDTDTVLRCSICGDESPASTISFTPRIRSLSSSCYASHCSRSQFLLLPLFSFWISSTSFLPFCHCWLPPLSKINQVLRNPRPAPPWPSTAIYDVVGAFRSTRRVVEVRTILANSVPFSFFSLGFVRGVFMELGFRDGGGTVGRDDGGGGGHK